jgi:hypothetical protein
MLSPVVAARFRDIIDTSAARFTAAVVRGVKPLRRALKLELV